jgi:hypothetical protein
VSQGVVELSDATQGGKAQPLSFTLKSGEVPCFDIIKGNYGAVIGWKSRIFACAHFEVKVVGFIWPITAQYVPLII